MGNIITCIALIFIFWFGRREGQHTQEELQKKNLRDELEERERRHFSSKDKSYSGKLINFDPFHCDFVKLLYPFFECI